MLKPCFRQAVSQPAGRFPHVFFMRRTGADAGNPDKILQFLHMPFVMFLQITVDSLSHRILFSFNESLAGNCNIFLRLFLQEGISLLPWHAIS
ncbi:hypothetical protein D3C87_1951020 [compost metagenome]